MAGLIGYGRRTLLTSQRGDANDQKSAPITSWEIREHVLRNPLYIAAAFYWQWVTTTAVKGGSKLGGGGGGGGFSGDHLPVSGACSCRARFFPPFHVI